MADLIDRQAAINAICRDWCNRDYCGDCYFYGARQAIDALKALPSADAVKVVRCMDCKYFEQDGLYDGWCHGWSDMIVDDGFCSFGERKGGE